MRVKQTARKSTGTPNQAALNRSRIRNDPVRNRMDTLLQTKRRGQTPRLSEPGPSGLGKGKKITFSGPESSVVKVKPRRKPGEAALAEIQRLRAETYNRLIPAAPFHRVVREVTHQLMAEREANGEPRLELRFQAAALEAIQEAAESYLVRLYEDANLCCLHAKRVTLFVQDMQLVRRLQRGQHPS